VKYLRTKIIVVVVVVVVEAVPTTITITITTSHTPITITITTTIIIIIAGRDSRDNNTVGMLATAAFLKHQWCHRMLRSLRRPAHQQQEEAEIVIAKADDPPPMKAGEVVEDEDDPMEVDGITTATAITTTRTVGVEVVAVVDEMICL
jgi:hypothetical protein